MRQSERKRRYANCAQLLTRDVNVLQGYTVFSIPVGIVYRPNEAKVKNLKTKDYLGKARLVAASDRANAFTGFAGTEMKRIQESLTASAKDDRPDDKLSYAATNLVKPNLASRSRQQSEPPISRNMFPPTPPPESENRPVEKYATGQMTRAQSVRGGGPKPQPLELGRAAFDQNQKPQRIGTQRSASERPRTDRDRAMSRERERGSSRSRDERSDRAERSRRYQSDEDSFEEDVYDMYAPRKSNQSAYSRGSKSRRPMYIEEEDEDDFDDDMDGAEFEMVSRQKTRRQAPARSGTTRRGNDVSKIRVKVHAEDTRYVVMDTNPSFAVFADQIRTKFGIRKNFKIKIKDDGDMITMADQDDLDMATMTALASAKREKADMAKMEVRNLSHVHFPLLTIMTGLDSGSLILLSRCLKFTNLFRYNLSVHTSGAWRLPKQDLLRYLPINSSYFGVFNRTIWTGVA